MPREWKKKAFRWLRRGRCTCYLAENKEINSCVFNKLHNSNNKIFSRKYFTCLFCLKHKFNFCVGTIFTMTIPTVNPTGTYRITDHATLWVCKDNNEYITLIRMTHDTYWNWWLVQKSQILDLHLKSPWTKKYSAIKRKPNYIIFVITLTILYYILTFKTSLCEDLCVPPCLKKKKI